MREILFRGKRVDNGEWVYGCLLKVTLNGKTAHLIFGDNFGFDGNDVKALSHDLVDPSTVCQYTGLTDKNGKRIFGGDVVEFCDIKGVINYNTGCYCVKTNKPDWKSRNNPAIDIVLNEYENELEIIGNIHDNPELLKEVS